MLLKWTTLFDIVPIPWANLAQNAMHLSCIFVYHELVLAALQDELISPSADLLLLLLCSNLLWCIYRASLISIPFTGSRFSSDSSPIGYFHSLCPINGLFNVFIITFYIVLFHEFQSSKVPLEVSDLRIMRWADRSIIFAKLVAQHST